MRSRQVAPSLQHFYLLDWYPDDFMVQRWVMSLKGGYQVLGVQRLLPHFAELSRPSGTLVYPVSSGPDHASLMAKLLAETWRLDALGIQKRTGTRQKRLNRQRRMKSQFVHPQSKISGPIHFVDDVVTTGGTALGCHKALNQPVKMTIWSLFYRHSL